jgi:hypothetical protein
MTLRALRLNAQTYPVEAQEVQTLALAGVELSCVEGQHADEILAAARRLPWTLHWLPWPPPQGLTRLTPCAVWRGSGWRCSTCV